MRSALLICLLIQLSLACTPPKKIVPYYANAKIESLCSGVQLIAAALKEGNRDQLAGAPRKLAGIYETKIHIVSFHDDYVNASDNSPTYHGRTKTEASTFAKWVGDCLKVSIPFTGNGRYSITHDGVYYSISENWGETTFFMMKG